MNEDIMNFLLIWKKYRRKLLKSLLVAASVINTGCNMGEAHTSPSQERFQAKRLNLLKSLAETGVLTPEDIARNGDASGMGGENNSDGDYVEYKNPLAGMPASSYTGMILNHMPTCINIPKIGGLSFANPHAEIDMLTSQQVLGQLSKFSNTASLSLEKGSGATIPLGKDLSKALGDEGGGDGAIAKLSSTGASLISPASFTIENKYLKEDLFNDNSLSFYYIYEYKTPITVNYNREHLLTDYAQQLYSKGPFQRLGFQSACGDSFISKFDGGAMFLLRMKISFNNRQNLTNISNNLSLSKGSASLGSVIASLKKDTKQEFTISLKASQFGGDPSRLSKIFEKTATHDLVCTSADLTPCYELINASLNYSSQIPEQMRDSQGKLKTEALYYYNPQILSYLKAGLNNDEAYRPEDTVVYEARAKITKIYNDYLRIRFSLPNYLEQIKLPQLEDSIRHLESRINYIEGTSSSCFDPASSNLCPQVYEQILQDLNNPEYSGFKVNFALLNFYFTSVVADNYLNLAQLYPVENTRLSAIGDENDSNNITFVPYEFDESMPIYINLNSFCGDGVTKLQKCREFKHEIMFSYHNVTEALIHPLNVAVKVHESCKLNSAKAHRYTCSGVGLSHNWTDHITFSSY